MVRLNWIRRDRGLEIGVLPAGGIGAGTLAREEFHDAARIVPGVCGSGGSVVDGSQDFVCWTDDIAAALQDDTAGGTKWGVFRSGRKIPRRARGVTD